MCMLYLGCNVNHYAEKKLYLIITALFKLSYLRSTENYPFVFGNVNNQKYAALNVKKLVFWEDYFTKDTNTFRQILFPMR